ncbi:hypothetical protein L596_013478 [Steinernema carpocapsae]|uniref:Autophagy-related protein n=1 Tax=Steinernema carpocapsae TaxID=34508 RepID=A0A4U5P0F3_STECR|nr:hypothetical protein L596_013478 [Steinernema carpocapsae]
MSVYINMEASVDFNNNEIATLDALLQEYINLSAAWESDAVTPKPAKDVRPFKLRYSFEERKALAQKHKASCGQEMVLVICEKSDSSQLPMLRKPRFKVPTTVTVGNFMRIIRQNLTLRDEESLFFFVRNTIPSSIRTIGELSHEFAEEDGFLYIQYQEESVYGN